MMQQIFNHAAEEAERPSKREEACGHRQRLVGMHSLPLHTLMGKVTIERAYSQCVVEKGNRALRAVMGKRHTMRCGDPLPDG